MGMVCGYTKFIKFNESWGWFKVKFSKILDNRKVKPISLGYLSYKKHLWVEQIL